MRKILNAITVLILGGTGLAIYLIIRDGVNISNMINLVGGLIVSSVWLYILRTKHLSLSSQLKNKDNNRPYQSDNSDLGCNPRSIIGIRKIRGRKE
jgi:hypothetical protein